MAIKKFKTGDIIYCHPIQKHYVIAEWDGTNGEVIPLDGKHSAHSISIFNCEKVGKSDKLKYKMFRDDAKKLLAIYRMKKVLDR